MKTNKLFFLAAMSGALILSSCSMNKQAFNQSGLKSGKLLAQQELTQPKVLQGKSSAQMQTLDLASESTAYTASQNKAFVPVLLKHRTAKKALVKKTGVLLVSGLPNTSVTNMADARKPAPTVANAAKKTHKSQSGDKSQLVALLLCIFLGGLGIHRFYLGYIGIGILELLTGGVFGILWLIDLIRIIMGTLKPKDGDYTDTL